MVGGWVVSLSLDNVFKYAFILDVTPNKHTHLCNSRVVITTENVYFKNEIQNWGLSLDCLWSMSCLQKQKSLDAVEGKTYLTNVFDWIYSTDLLD